VDSDKWEFAAEGFLRGARGALATIQRKKPGGARGGVQTAAGGGVQAAPGGEPPLRCAVAGGRAPLARSTAPGASQPAPH
jgi:hypothetical protein